MLKPDQEKYLLTIPEDKIVHIQAFDPKVQLVAQKLIDQITSQFPDVKVFYIGASPLGIAGQNDIDLNILSEDKFDTYAEEFKKIFGEPVRVNERRIRWEFQRDGFEVELYLKKDVDDIFREQITVFELLKGDLGLRSEYEKIKLDSDGIPFREYMKRKYEFFNRILEL